jgi:hypothetical protein
MLARDALEESTPVRALHALLEDPVPFALDPATSLSVPTQLALYEWPVPSYALVAQFDEAEVAEQLCVIAAAAYRAISPSELAGLRWSRAKHAVLARNVLAYAQSVERVSFWAATYVLAQNKIKERVRALGHVIAIAKELETRRNFSALMGLLNGLSLNSVARLKHTWEALPRKAHECYDALASYQNPSGSFKVLRDAMKVSAAGTLPYLGIYLQDLTSLDENVDFVTPAEGETIVEGEGAAINLAKHVLVGHSIVIALQHQAHHTDALTPPRREPLHSLLLELPHLNATELYYVSLEREPRQTPPSQ